MDLFQSGKEILFLSQERLMKELAMPYTQESRLQDSYQEEKMGKLQFGQINLNDRK